MKFEKGDIVVLKSNLYTFITIVDDRLAVPYAEYKMIKCSYCIHNMNSTNYKWLDINNEVFYKEVYEPTWHQIKLFKDALAKENKYYCEKTKTIKEMKKEFTKKDLKSGMWVELRSGDKYLVVTNVHTLAYGKSDFVFISNNGFCNSSMFLDNLDVKCGNKNKSVVKVFSNPYGNIESNTYSGKDMPLIWERETEEEKQRKKMQYNLEEMKKAYNELEKNISETLDKLNGLKK